MKIKFLLVILLFLGTYATSYASFPVERAKVNETTVSNSISKANGTTTYVSPAASGDKDLTVGILLWLFLGWAAGHRWYYGKPVGWNILFILTAGGFLVWWIVDLINMIDGNF